VDFVEDGASTNHSDGRNDHELKSVEASPITGSVVVLKCSDSLSDDLRLGILATKG
jgi:hypothetical protein